MSFHTDGDHGNQENVLKLDFLFLKIATMMRYYLTDKKKDFRPYFAFGITNNIALQYSTVDYGDDPSGEPILEFVRTYEQDYCLAMACITRDGIVIFDTSSPMEFLVHLFEISHAYRLHSCWVQAF
jgi:hypothetical protein